VVSFFPVASAGGQSKDNNERRRALGRSSQALAKVKNLLKEPGITQRGGLPAAWSSRLFKGVFR